MDEVQIGNQGNKSVQSAGQDSSVSSRYQQMLAKARAEKEELREVTPDTKVDTEPSMKTQGNTADQESSSSSRYQQMLARARAEKAKS